MSTNSSFDFQAFFDCVENNFHSTVSVFAYFFIKSVLILPLSIFILHLGHQRWRSSSSSSSTAAAASHSDVFTFHLAAMELIGFSGNVVYLCGFYLPRLFLFGFCLAGVNILGEIMFHVLTCVERYVAVVRPITYLGLKQRGGVRIRNACIGCVWLMSFSWCGVAEYYAPDLPIIPFFCFLFFIWFVTSLCSAAVLCVLIRPSPGEVGGDRERVSESKRKAFYTVAVILAVLWFWFVGLSVCIVLDESTLFSYGVGCVLLTAGFMFSMPGSLVLPLLFLHRAGKLRCRGPTTEAG